MYPLGTPTLPHVISASFVGLAYGWGLANGASSAISDEPGVLSSPNGTKGLQNLVGGDEFNRPSSVHIYMYACINVFIYL